MTHPGASDWQDALVAAGIPADASMPDIAEALHALGLEWRFRRIARPTRANPLDGVFSVDVWTGPGTTKPMAAAGIPVWTGTAPWSIPEALGHALRKYFATHEPDRR